MQSQGKTAFGTRYTETAGKPWRRTYAHTYTVHIGPTLLEFNWNTCLKYRYFYIYISPAIYALNYFSV